MSRRFNYICDHDSWCWFDVGNKRIGRVIFILVSAQIKRLKYLLLGHGHVGSGSPGDFCIIESVTLRDGGRIQVTRKLKIESLIKRIAFFFPLASRLGATSSGRSLYSLDVS
jgi:hypothetical protein